MATLVALVSVVAVSVVAPVAPAAKQQRTATWSTSLQTGILAEINALRASHGLSPLKASRSLGAAAAAHSKQMAAKGFFAHESADGGAFWKRIQRYYSPKGYGSWYVGENLLWSSPDLDASSALKQWLNSAPHRKNLLSTQWREIGIAALHVSSAPGVFGSREVTIVTTDFGARR
jgi:uncharacterized protein YkwD